MKFFQTLTYIAIKIEMKLRWDSVTNYFHNSILMLNIKVKPEPAVSNQKLYSWSLHDVTKKDAGHKVKTESKKFWFSLVMTPPVSDQNSSHSFTKKVVWCQAFWISFHSGPENLKKSSQKNSWNTISQKFFSWNCIFGSFKLFPSSKIDFLSILKLQKMDFYEKNFFVKLISLISRFF